MVISKSNGAKNSTDPIRRSIVLIASEQKLIMMRPYQVYAVKHIVTCIHEDSGNGIIWHTTGSGKTLTSFQGLYPRHSARHATAEDAKRGVVS